MGTGSQGPTFLRPPTFSRPIVVAEDGSYYSRGLTPNYYSLGLTPNYSRISRQNIQCWHYKQMGYILRDCDLSYGLQCFIEQCGSSFTYNFSSMIPTTCWSPEVKHTWFKQTRSLTPWPNNHPQHSPFFWDIKTVSQAIGTVAPSSSLSPPALPPQENPS